MRGIFAKPESTGLVQMMCTLLWDKNFNALLRRNEERSRYGPNGEVEAGRLQVMYPTFQADRSTVRKERNKKLKQSRDLFATKNFYSQTCCKLNDKKRFKNDKKYSKMKYEIRNNVGNAINDDKFVTKKKKKKKLPTKHVDFSGTKRDTVQLVCHQLQYTNQSVQKLRLWHENTLMLESHK